MSIAWIAPSALAGLALIALPIAIHLLVRQHARTIAFPSLRFLRETQLAAFRRRTLQDVALLACRIAIVSLAAMALAGPIIETASRTAGHAKRLSRAVVVIGSPGSRMPSDDTEVFATATFERAAIADAIADAVRWLNLQPPSSREVVIAGTLSRGAVTAADLSLIPPDIGVRFDANAADVRSDLTMPVLTRRGGTLALVDQAVQLDVDATNVREGTAVPVANSPIAIRAAEADRPVADAALSAVLDAGVPWSHADRRVVIVWTGADESRGGGEENAEIIRMAVPTPPSSAADAVMKALTAKQLREFAEPVSISEQQLAAWTTSPGLPRADAPPGDEGDRRWLWLSALVMLAFETWLRRSRSASDPSAVIVDDSEARVA